MAQVYHAHPDPKKWIKFKTGVVCFVKDNLRKSYYIRLLEINVSLSCFIVICIVYTICRPPKDSH